MKRRDAHKILLGMGAALMLGSLPKLDVLLSSDLFWVGMFWGGVLLIGLGVHGIWKVSA